MPVSASFSGQFVVFYPRNDYIFEEKIRLLFSEEVECFAWQDINENLLLRIKKGFPERLKKQVRLIFPFKVEEKRHKSVVLPNAQLFLGSALLRNGFQVKCESHLLGTEDIVLDSEQEIVGITVLEDNVPQLAAFIKEKFSSSSIFLMLGGPFITLAREDSVSYFPMANLLVRGEAEYVLPEILEAICKVDVEKLFTCKGFIFQWQDLLLVSNFEHENYLQNLSKVYLSAELFVGKDLSSGLELNLLRGCRRNCIFCSHLQKSELRYYPLNQLENFLDNYQKLLESSGEKSPFAYSVNINDDDILQDKDYFFHVAQLLKIRGFSLWGLQTSLEALFVDTDHPDSDFLDRLDVDLFVANKPLFWIGTDIFISSRAKRMVKFLPSDSGWNNLLETFEKKAVENYHYWILSDFLSDWDEFVTELRKIELFTKRFNHFHIMPIAPFLIPYAHTPAFRFIQIAKATDRIIYRTGNCSEVYPLVLRVETAWPLLNSLLLKRTIFSEEVDFFSALKNTDFFQVWKVVYDYLRQERLQSVDQKVICGLRQIEAKVESYLAEVICVS